MTPLFRNDREAVFVERPNRFLIIARAGKTLIPCHCPNPGRLMEMLFPGTRLILEAAGRDGAGGRTAYTAAGVYCRDGVAPLFSARANRAAEKLFLPLIIPGLRELRPEFSLGNSRFDFLCLDGQGRRHLVEVKACSLVEHGTAMFPDAPSARALKHLEELAALSAGAYCCHVLFVIVHGNPGRFVPNLHTDPLFAAALSRYGRPAGPVAVHAGLLRCGSDGGAALVSPSIPVDLSHGELAAADGGNYLIILRIPGPVKTEIGALGLISFRSGWYVYTGSARRGLSKRISRHIRKTRKQKHWHLDYLSPRAAEIKGFPVYSYRNLECALARSLAALGGRGVPGFGCSDCGCSSHLYYFSRDPVTNRDFVDMLLRFRHIEGLLPADPAPGG
jgi:sugar fermentation stimulation protein A